MVAKKRRKWWLRKSQLRKWLRKRSQCMEEVKTEGHELVEVFVTGVSTKVELNNDSERSTENDQESTDKQES